MTHDLLQGLWLHQTTDVAVSGVTFTTTHITIHATTTRVGVECPSCGTSSGHVPQLRALARRQS